MSDLRKALRSLPKDLDDTYARILQNIDNKGYGDQVAKILQWLAYSFEPMSPKEVAEVLTVDMESYPLVDLDRRLEDPQDILELCSSLVSIGPRKKWTKETLQFAHFSVREFLESPRLDSGPARKFAVDEMRANILIVESCIAYNIYLDSLQVNMDISIIREEYPLSLYASNWWGIHAGRAQESGRIISLCERLFRSDSPELPSWLAVFSSLVCFTDLQGRFLPLNCATYLSLPRMMRKLILEGARVNEKDKKYGETPLIIATNTAKQERVEDVQFLVNHGAEVNAQDDNGYTALMYASQAGFIQIMRILLDNGAAIDIQNRERVAALSIASAQGNNPMVHSLLDRGASTSSPNGSRALDVACSLERYEAVQILLNGGVDVDAECDDADCFLVDYSGTVLLRAILKDHYDIAELLLKYGANVNARLTFEEMHVVALEHTLMLFGIFWISGETYEKRLRQLDKRIMFLIENGADPKLVNTENLDYEAKKRYDALLNERGAERRHRVD